MMCIRVQQLGLVAAALGLGCPTLWATEQVAFTVPTVLEAVDLGGDPPVIVPGDPLFEAGVWTIDAQAEIGVLADVAGSGAIGLAQGPDAELYTGVVINTAPLVVAVDRIEPDGTTLRLGTILDSTGAVLSILGRAVDLAWGPDGWVYFTAPKLLSDKDPGVILAAAGIRKLDPATGAIESVASVEAAATTGLGFDGNGTLWFGAVTTEFPVQISLQSVDQDGAVVDHGVIFDTSAGLIVLNGFTFDLAPDLDGHVFFTTTTVYDETLMPLTPAAIRRFDVESGLVDTVAIPGGPVVAGLALAESGEIWFGSGASLAPLVFEIARTTVDGTVETLGTAFDTTGGLYSLTDQGLDLAVAPHAALAFLGAACPADVDASNAVDFADLLALLASWGPCGDACLADLDGSGVVDFTDLISMLSAWGPC